MKGYQRKTCPNCLANAPAFAERCHHCGHRFGLRATRPAALLPARSARRRGVVFWALVSAALGLLLSLGFLAYQGL